MYFSCSTPTQNAALSLATGLNECQMIFCSVFVTLTASCSSRLCVSGPSGSGSRRSVWSCWLKPAGCSCPRTTCTPLPRPPSTYTCTKTTPPITTTTRGRPCCPASSPTLKISPADWEDWFPFVCLDIKKSDNCLNKVQEGFFTAGTHLCS